ncbi:hypothetical protein [Streptomyces aureus]
MDTASVEAEQSRGLGGVQGARVESAGRGRREDDRGVHPGAPRVPLPLGGDEQQQVHRLVRGGREERR